MLKWFSLARPDGVVSPSLCSTVAHPELPSAPQLFMLLCLAARIERAALGTVSKYTSSYSTRGYIQKHLPSFLQQVPISNPDSLFCSGGKSEWPWDLDFSVFILLCFHQFFLPSFQIGIIDWCTLVLVLCQKRFKTCQIWTFIPLPIF